MTAGASDTQLCIEKTPRYLNLTGTIQTVATPVDTAIENLVRLRACERGNPGLGDTLEPVIEQLVGLAGATVSRSTAARLLGVSQPALDRWVACGELSSVLTPTGRRSVPVEHLVELLDDVREARDRGHQRPLKAVIEARRQRAAALELDDILDQTELASVRAHGHRRAELLSLGYHRVVAQRLDDRLVRQAGRRLRRWQAEGKLPAQIGAAWQTLLDSPREEIAAVISADSQLSRDLRQSTPFAGALSEQERARLLALVRTQGVLSPVAS